jgi:hypothetical protein
MMKAKMELDPRIVEELELMKDNIKSHCDPYNHYDRRRDGEYALECVVKLIDLLTKDPDEKAEDE